MSQILQDVADSTLSTLVERWLAWRAEERFPTRKAIEPTELGAALPFVWICEKDSEVECYRYRLVGEAVNTLYGKGLRGRVLSDFLSEATARRIQNRLDQCLSSGILIHTIAPQTLHDNRHVLVQRLFLPILSDHGSADTILGCTKVTASIKESERASVSSHEAAYTRDGDRLKSGNSVLTMFSSELEY